MAAYPETKSNFSSLEIRIQKLIHLYEEVKQENLKLLADKHKLELELTEERGKMEKIEEGYRNLKEIEKTSSRKSILNMKRKINDIIVEIDKNISLIENK